MIKRRTWIFVALFGLVVLVSFLIRTSTDDDTSVEVVEQPDPLWSLSGSDIERLLVEDFQADRLLEVRRDENSLWWMEQPESREVDPARVERAVSWLIAPQPRSEIGLVENLSPYGLQNPAFKVTVVLKDGTELSFDVGRYSPTGGSRYLLMQGGSSIVLMSDFGLLEVLDLFGDLQVTPTPQDTEIP
jgi:hypothetical protein